MTSHSVLLIQTKIRSLATYNTLKHQVKNLDHIITPKRPLTPNTLQACFLRNLFGTLLFVLFTLRYGVLTVNFLYIFRTIFLKNTSDGLFLILVELERLED